MAIKLSNVSEIFLSMALANHSQKYHAYAYAIVNGRFCDCSHSCLLFHIFCSLHCNNFLHSTVHWPHGSGMNWTVSIYKNLYIYETKENNINIQQPQAISSLFRFSCPLNASEIFDNKKYSCIYSLITFTIAIIVNIIIPLIKMIVAFVDNFL